jgi:dipeptidyl aminopeptidase/acylaminoacyl peptidase
VLSQEVQTGSNSGPRGSYYLYLRQNGLWAREVSGFNPRTEREKFDRYCPVRNITPQYPPILMIHGTADTDVPYLESVDMAAQLQLKGVEHEMITIQDGPHGWRGVEEKVVAEAHRRVAEFVGKHLD